MRILFLANNDVGLYRFRQELLAELLKDHEVFIALPDGEFIPKLQEMGCQYIPFEFNRHGLNPLADLWQIHRYRKLLRQLRPQVVLTYTIKPNVYGGIACQKEHIPYIANVTGLGTAIENGGVLAGLSLALYRRGLKGATKIFFQNSANWQFFLDQQVVCLANTQLLSGSGVNLEAFVTQPYPPEAKGIRFLFVGRIMRDKGIGELLQAIIRLHSTNPQITLDIVGGYDESAWVERVHEAAAAGAVCYHGQQSDVRPFYQNCHCVVLPSYHEGMANVLLEASATARPVIATRVPGCQETFDEGVSGFGCEAKNSDSLLSAMQKFLSLSHEQRAAMGNAARTKVAREFDRRMVVREYLAAIEATK